MSIFRAGRGVSRAGDVGLYRGGAGRGSGTRHTNKRVVFVRRPEPCS